MKKAILSVLLLLPALTVPAKEIKGLIGINWSKYLFSSTITGMDRQNRTGIHLGLGWAFDLNPKMQVEAEVLFSEKGARTSLAYASDKLIPAVYKNTSLGFPVLFKYKLNEGASPYAALGPEFLFILSHHLKISDDKESFNLSKNTKKFVLGVIALLGYQFPVGRWNLFAEVRYSRWLSNFMVSTEATVKCESVSILLGGAYVL